MTSRPTIRTITVPGSTYDQMRRTVRLIGRAIRQGSQYAPIRFRAARLAATARPKDYLGQARAVFDDFVKRWRYVKDPVGAELVATSPIQIYETIMGGENGRGHGDCDDATVAIGAQLEAIGIPVRVATIAPQHAPRGRLMSHVFIQAQIPGHGWVTVDPVVYPARGFGFLPPHSRLVTYDLNGREQTRAGNVAGLLGDTDMDDRMYTDIGKWQDWAGLGDYSTDYDLPDFRKVGIKDFGMYSEALGIMPGLGLVAEVDVDEQGRAWTPALEIAPADYQYLKYRSTPYDGMLALGDNGAVYQYDGSLGFFKKLFKKVVGKVKDIGKKVLKKLPGGKYLLRLGSKLWAISKKLVGPLMKIVGPLAKKLAPVAALIPGYGPAIAGALYTTGKIADLMKKYNVKLTGKTGEISKLRFPSDVTAKKFQAALVQAAQARKEAVSKKYITRAKRLKSQVSARKRAA